MVARCLLAFLTRVWVQGCLPPSAFSCRAGRNPRTLNIKHTEILRSKNALAAAALAAAAPAAATLAAIALAAAALAAAALAATALAAAALAAVALAAAVLAAIALTDTALFPTTAPAGPPLPLPPLPPLPLALAAAPLTSTAVCPPLLSPLPHRRQSSPPSPHLSPPLCRGAHERDYQLICARLSYSEPLDCSLSPLISAYLRQIILQRPFGLLFQDARRCIPRTSPDCHARHPAAVHQRPQLPLHFELRGIERPR